MFKLRGSQRASANAPAERCKLQPFPIFPPFEKIVKLGCCAAKPSGTLVERILRTSEFINQRNKSLWCSARRQCKSGIENFKFNRMFRGHERGKSGVLFCGKCRSRRKSAALRPQSPQKRDQGKSEEKRRINGVSTSKVGFFNWSGATIRGHSRGKSCAQIGFSDAEQSSN